MRQDRNFPLPGRPRTRSASALLSIKQDGEKIAILLTSFFLLAGMAGSAFAGEQPPSGPDTSFMSRMTIAVPLFTQHYPGDRYFNDHNWGAVLFYALDGHFSLAGGDFINSYRRNTAFGGLSIVPWTIGFPGVQIDPGLLLAFDFNEGYKGYDSLDPLLGAATIKISGHYFDDPRYQFLNRTGLLMTVIPGFGNDRSTAFNLALTFGL